MVIKQMKNVLLVSNLYTFTTNYINLPYLQTSQAMLVQNQEKAVQKFKQQALFTNDNSTGGGWSQYDYLWGYIK